MSHSSTDRNPSGALSRRVLGGLAALLVALLATASAQSLTNLLPQDTFVVIGVSGLQQHEAKFQPFIDEWERLDLTTLFGEAFEGEDAADGDPEESMPAAFKELGLFDFLGDELWLALSASRNNPMPAFTVVGRVSAEAAAALQQALDEAMADGEFQVLTEGNIEFRVGASDEFEEPIAFALEGDFVAVSSNPDVLRGVLRRFQGAAEPSFLDSRGYAETLAPLLPSNLVLYFDMPHIVDLAKPFTAGMGFDATADRLARTLKTFGTYGSAVRVTGQGLESLSLQVLGDPTLDPGLYALLTQSGPASGAPMRFLSPDAIGYQAASVDFGGWWAYLDELVADLPELGIGSLDAFIVDNLGLDLDQLLFGWMGDTFAAITPYQTAPAEIGVMPDNLLGDSLYLIETTDPAAAAQGLQTLIQMGGMFASGFADPYGEGAAGPIAPQQRTVAGVSVDSYEFSDGVVVEVAVTDDYVLFATSSEAMDAALAASAAGGGPAGELAALAGQLPLGATSVALVDGAATLRMLGDQLASQFGLFTGLTGPDFDFDTAERAGEALSEYIEFVAGKAGGSYSYGVADGGVLRGYALWNITW